MDDGAPTVSVIIPNYNYERTLGACLDAVFAQTYPPHEVIVVDDGSTDSSPALARSYPCTVLESAGNGGPATARNLGAAAATGDVLFFLDSDIAPCPDALEQAVALLHAEPGLGCVHGLPDKVPLYDDGPVEVYRCLHEYHWRWRATGLVQTVFFALCAMPRAVFEEIGPLDETLRESEDVEYSERLSPRYPIRLTDTYTGRHDDADRLLPLLREQFRRSQLLVSFAGAHRFSPGALKANRMPGVLTAAATWASLPVAALLHPAGWLLPLALLLLFGIADPALARFVVRERGLAYWPRFMGYHFLVHTALLAGVARGCVRMVTDRGFRRPRAHATGREHAGGAGGVGGASGADDDPGPGADDPVPERGRGRRLWQKLLLGAVLAAAGTGLLLAVRATDTEVLRSLLSGHGPLLIAASLTLNMCGLWLGMASWKVLLGGLGSLVRRAAAARIFFFGLLSKFLPGPVWGLLVHLQLGRAAGAARGHLVAAYVLSLGTTLASGLAVGLLVAPSVLGGGAWWLAAPVALLVALAVRPGLVGVALRAGARLVRRPLPGGPGETGSMPDSAMRRSLLLGLGSWVLAGLHVWPLALAFGAPASSALLVSVGGFALATAVGGLTLVLPDGLGAREAVLVLALASVMPWPEATAVAVASRLVCTAAEALGGGVVVLATRGSWSAPPGVRLPKDTFV